MISFPSDDTAPGFSPKTGAPAVTPRPGRLNRQRPTSPPGPAHVSRAGPGGRPRLSAGRHGARFLSERRDDDPSPGRRHSAGVSPEAGADSVTPPPDDSTASDQRAAWTAARLSWRAGRRPCLSPGRYLGRVYPSARAAVSHPIQRYSAGGFNAGAARFFPIRTGRNQKIRANDPGFHLGRRGVNHSERGGGHPSAGRRQRRRFPSLGGTGFFPAAGSGISRADAIRGFRRRSPASDSTASLGRTARPESSPSAAASIHPPGDDPSAGDFRLLAGPASFRRRVPVLPGRTPSRVSGGDPRRRIPPPVSAGRRGRNHPQARRRQSIRRATTPAPGAFRLSLGGTSFFPAAGSGSSRSGYHRGFRRRSPASASVTCPSWTTRPGSSPSAAAVIPSDSRARTFPAAATTPGVHLSARGMTGGRSSSAATTARRLARTEGPNLQRRDDNRVPVVSLPLPLSLCLVVSLSPLGNPSIGGTS